MDEEPRKQTPPNKQHTDANTDYILPFKMPFELQRDLFGEPSATADSFAEIVSEAKPKAVKRFFCFYKRRKMVVVVAFKVKFHVTCQIIHLLTDRWRWRDSDRETDREKQTINQKMRIFSASIYKSEQTTNPQ